MNRPATNESNAMKLKQQLAALAALAVLAGCSENTEMGTSKQAAVPAVTNEAKSAETAASPAPPPPAPPAAAAPAAPATPAPPPPAAPAAVDAAASNAPALASTNGTASNNYPAHFGSRVRATADLSPDTFSLHDALQEARDADGAHFHWPLPAGPAEREGGIAPGVQTLPPKCFFARNRLCWLLCSRKVRMA